MYRRPGRFLIVFCLIIFAVALGGAMDKASNRAKRQTQFRITAVPWGPSQVDVDRAKARVASSSALLSAVGNAGHRLLSFEFIEAETKTGGTKPPTRFRAIYYDYTNDRTLAAEGDFAGKEPISIREENFQPIASPEEFKVALEILGNDPFFSASLRSGQLETFEPMPDVTVLNGTTERLINVGLELSGNAGTEIVSVSLGRRAVIRHESGAPQNSRAATPDGCGLAPSGQAPTGRGILGQATLTISDGPTTLWEMLVIRPSASSGTRGSGVEIRDVKYKGKSVLKRGHVPILKVQYTPQTC
ncbi:MAG TPA: hypothetical protein VFZ23_09245, partial [Pyrinomonadaceae bacterium]